VWDASVVLGRYLSKQAKYFGASVTRKSVLELGAGCGIPAILCATRGYGRVDLTDKEEVRMMMT
jgi:predicted nicotinamide N-methyase